MDIPVRVRALLNLAIQEPEADWYEQLEELLAEQRVKPLTMPYPQGGLTKAEWDYYGKNLGIQWQ